MRWLLRLVLFFAVLWGGYWFVGARGLEKAARAWFSGQAAQGYLAQNAGLAVQGFPNRFDLTITDPRLSDPARGIGWQAPFVQILSLSYRPWHVIAALPPTQTLTLPGSTLTLTSDKLQASLIVKPTPALMLDRLAIAGSGLTLRADSGWQISAQSARLATRQAPLLRNSHEIGFEIKGLTPDRALTSALVPPADMPATIDQIALSLLPTFSAPLDRFTAQSRPVLVSLEVKEAMLIWGDVTLFASGTLTPDGAGFAQGTLDLRLENWQKALAAGVAFGAIPPSAVATWEQAASLLAARSTDANRIDIALTFDQGLIRLGAFPLGAAPRLN